MGTLASRARISTEDRSMHAQNRLLHLSLALVVLSGAVTPAAAQKVTEFPIPTANSGPTSITAGPDGALWFTEINSNANKIGRITTAGVIIEFTVLRPAGARWHHGGAGRRAVVHREYWQ
jgi:streptogramin lyase